MRVAGREDRAAERAERGHRRRRSARSARRRARPRHGQCRHGDAPVHRPARRTIVRFHAGRRQLADQAPRWSASPIPLRRMGAVHRDPCGLAAGAHSGPAAGCTGIHYDLPVASAQVKSAILLGGLYAHGVTSVSEPAVTRDHSERMLAGFRCGYVPSRTAPRASPVRASCAPATSKCRAICPRPLSSSSPARLAAQGTLTLRNVGINPTRTGVIEILRLMGAHIRVTNERRSGSEPVADLEIERSDLHGVAVPPALVPLAIDEFPAIFVAAACAARRNDGDGRCRAAREGKRPHRRDGARPGASRHRTSRFCRTACGSAAGRCAAGASTAAAIIASPWLSRWRACVRRESDRNRRRGERGDILPGLREHGAARSESSLQEQT